jgi:hypothetical protein
MYFKYMKPTRINIYGGPGCGKSTIAAWLFGELKARGVVCELAQEYAKKWAYEKKKIHGYDQIYIMGKQIQREYDLMKAGVKIIISDSPVVLSYVYANFYFGNKRQMVEGVRRIVSSFVKECDNINIRLLRVGKYSTLGRYEDERLAREVDKAILRAIKRFHRSDFEAFTREDERQILDYAMTSLADKRVPSH